MTLFDPVKKAAQYAKLSEISNRLASSLLNHSEIELPEDIRITLSEWEAQRDAFNQPSDTSSSVKHVA